MQFKLMGLFPAVTPYRLAMVSLAISLITPILWGVWWVPLSKEMPEVLQGWVPRLLWETWPLAIFPAGFALVTYLMYKAGMMKSDGQSIRYPLHPELSNHEYYKQIDHGLIKPIR